MQAALRVREKWLFGMRDGFYIDDTLYKKDFELRFFRPDRYQIAPAIGKRMYLLGNGRLWGSARLKASWCDSCVSADNAMHVMAGATLASVPSLFPPCVACT